jgi:hypothetical protein
VTLPRKLVVVVNNPIPAVKVGTPEWRTKISASLKRSATNSNNPPSPLARARSTIDPPRALSRASARHPIVTPEF